MPKDTPENRPYNLLPADPNASLVLEVNFLNRALPLLSSSMALSAGFSFSLDVFWRSKI